VKIELNVSVFSSHAAPFRAAAKRAALGRRVYRCYTLRSLQSQSTQTLPYVIMYHDVSACFCATAPILLPDHDIVLGEHIAFASDGAGAVTLYPAGTVLYHPRCVFPPVGKRRDVNYVKP